MKRHFSSIVLVFPLLMHGLLAVPTPDPDRTTSGSSSSHQHDSSDMLMQPDEIHDESRSYFTGTEVDTGFHPVFPSYSSISRVESSSDRTVTAEQNFFPFYRDSQPLGHSRPYYPTPEPPVTSRYNSYRSHDTLLGSGDFGVLRGGTFYQDSDPPIKGGDDYYSYYNNGHGRPQASPLVRKLTYPDEQFANFKDFADINTPGDAAFSHFVVVYANKNATAPVNHPSPKNIFEQLQMLDKEGDKKASKFKTKLAKTKLEKKYKKKLGPKAMDAEPLLAVS